MKPHGYAVLTILLVAHGTGSFARAEPVVTRAFLEEQFVIYDKDRPRKKAVRADKLSALQERLYELQARGHPMQCSAQILNETDWILDSTSDYARADKNLWLLDLSLAAVNQDFALQQLETDGSWGVCYDEWFKKLDPMINALNRFSEANVPPKYAYLAFLKQISKPELLMGYLDSILISDIATTGINFRDELNASTSLVAEVLYKERIRNYFVRYITGRPIAPTYIQAFNLFVEKWQDPQTGYWGAWYRSDGRVLKSRDLSMTYHIIAYRRGDVSRWGEIFDTTLEISDLEYPFGWLQNGSQTNHHAYDVARILKFGWNQVSDEQRQRARPALQRLLDFALTSGINADNSVTPQARFSSGVDDAYYYAVSLLTTIGYCSSERPFWTDATWPEANVRCCGLARHIESQKARTPTIEGALERIRSAVPDCAAKATTGPGDESIDSFKLDDQGGR
ncbi:MAG TPA: hypothetical protein VK961_20860 [Chthoniobacter sp.]|nr:hypothetical protein [Chthoniobacter sp.]